MNYLIIQLLKVQNFLKKNEKKKDNSLIMYYIILFSIM